jgi:antitoxin component YwqK of YwqJK toxin-antitoxin module
MVDGTGTFRTWYDDGRPRTEVSAVRGLPTGRVRHWDKAGEIIADGFMFKGRKISRKRYGSLAALDKDLPRYDEINAKT